MVAELAQIVWESERKHLRIGWYDPEQTILVLQVLDRWTWADAVLSIAGVLDPTITAKAPQPVYTIITHDRYARFLPKGGNPLAALRRILQTDSPNEALVVFVRQADVIRSFLGAVIRVYKFTNADAKYRFVESFEQALAEIAAHKAKTTRPSRIEQSKSSE
ncbi:MAG: hypothetical protein RML95_03975 [Anaerolineae bacterium]|nr:hypothetical protein [Anaerolineae bacterium]